MQGRAMKAALVEAGIPFYVAAAAVGLHPGRLSQFLNSHEPLPERLANKLAEVIGGSKEPTGANA